MSALFFDDFRDKQNGKYGTGTRKKKRPCICSKGLEVLKKKQDTAVQKIGRKTACQAHQHSTHDQQKSVIRPEEGPCPW